MLLVGCILLERSIIFQHKSKAVVSAACVALTGIMHPLWWGNNFITTLPESLPELLDSPVPVLLGVSFELDDEFDHADNAVYVDLESNEVRLIDDAYHHVKIPLLNMVCHKLRSYSDTLYKEDYSW